MSFLQSLKKTFVDDPKRRTKKIYYWCFHVLGMYFSFLYLPYYYLYVRRLQRIGKDGRVGMMQVASLIVRGCNLRCEYCTTFSPSRKGVFPADDLIASYREWRKKLKPQFFFLSGGEPFLHPELERLVRESAKIWNESKLRLITNGLLLDRAKPELLRALRETAFELLVTEHTFEPKHRKKLDAGYARLKQEGIPFVVVPSRLTWAARYQYDNEKKGMEGQDENPVPYNSDPRMAWNHCKVCDCTAINGDQLYKCVPLLSANLAVQEGILNADLWKAALTYSPPTLRSTPEEILELLRRQAMPECTVCPGKTAIVPARQLPSNKERMN